MTENEAGRRCELVEGSWRIGDLERGLGLWPLELDFGLGLGLDRDE